jgi:K+ transporter
LHNIVEHPAILAALNPLYGIEFLLANKATWRWWRWVMSCWR